MVPSRACVGTTIELELFLLSNLKYRHVSFLTYISVNRFKQLWKKSRENLHFMLQPRALSRTILFYNILYHTILYRTILYRNIMYRTVLYHTILYRTILYITILYCTILYCTILYCTILYRTILYHTILYCTVPGGSQEEEGFPLVEGWRSWTPGTAQAQGEAWQEHCTGLDCFSTIVMYLLYCSNVLLGLFADLAVCFQ